MAELYGIFLYFVFLLTIGGIYAIICLGLNLQWGMAGIFNAGVAGFVGIGAYSMALVTTRFVPLTGVQALDIAAGLVAAMVLAGLTGWAVARICLRLRSDYLAIASLGVAETIRLIFNNEDWLTNGPRGINNIPRPFDGFALPWNQISFMLLTLSLMLGVYLVMQRLKYAPWGRTLRAIRDNEVSAAAMGKDVSHYRQVAFVIGCAVIGLAGGLQANYFKFIDPYIVDPLLSTFLVWVMLIIGGSGNNRGAVAGAFAIWAVWSLTELISMKFLGGLASKSIYIRVFLIGLILQVFLQRYRMGIFPEFIGTPTDKKNIRGKLRQ